MVTAAWRSRWLEANDFMRSGRGRAQSHFSRIMFSTFSKIGSTFEMSI